MGGMGGAASALKCGDRVATFRCNPRFVIVSSDWTARQVHEVTHADVFVEQPQFRTADRKEAA
jgi:hypothetical protein